MRLGLNRRVEVGFGWIGYADVEDKSDSAHTGGALDGQVDVKIAIGRQHMLIPDHSLFAGVNVPFGRGPVGLPMNPTMNSPGTTPIESTFAFGEMRFLPEFAVLAEHVADSRFSLLYDLGPSFGSSFSPKTTLGNCQLWNWQIAAFLTYSATAVVLAHKRQSSSVLVYGGYLGSTPLNASLDYPSGD